MNKYSLDEINSDEQLLEKIKNVDGAGSGLDADLVQGIDIVATKLDTANLLTEIKAVDGVSSGLDADLLRGFPADFTNSLASNGYQKLPSGLIMQWVAFIAVNANTTVTVTFPIAFPTTSITVQATNRADGGSGYTFDTANYSATTVDIGNPSSYNRTATLFVIGY